MLTFDEAKEFYFDFRIKEGVGNSKGYLALQKLYKYYMGHHEIQNKKDRKNGNKTFRIVHNFPKYTATISTGYFMGMPVTYNTTETKALEPALDIMDENDGQTVDYDNALDMSIYGRAFRLFYHDEEGELNYKDIDPRHTIAVYDDSIKPKITDVIRFSETVTKDNEIKVEMTIYDKVQYIKYSFVYEGKILGQPLNEILDISIENMSQEEEQAHNIVDEDGNPRIPVIKIQNNKFELGDYEDILPTIDAYNDLQSGSMEDLSDFTDAILKLVNMNETNHDDINSLKEDKVMLLDENGDAEWLVKQINDTFNENMKTRVENDIHKYTFVPNMNDKEFGGNLSGIAIKYKLLALEQVRGQKERMFNRALTDQLGIIKGYLDKLPGSKEFGLKDVKIQFTPNLPANYLEEADLVVKLRQAGLPDKFIYQYLSAVQDIEHLIEMKKEQEEEEYDSYKDTFSGENDNVEEQGKNDATQERQLSDGDKDQTPGKGQGDSKKINQK
ncbi:phage portal protein [Bacillus thuringiensis]|uniref:Phage portal protein n=1 Tax=Bacillus thuringiensis serovar subtoxicus TaxID=475791 RepID=A0A9X6FFF0_BACTU|nr:phage portal protein [Bacillus thuringiensis]MEB4840307.1 phage portal protein [Paenibacillus jamilae]MEB8580880.1 phage portal protein [Bacillus cereus]AMR84362.1 portal protein [Bacillus thuringiensis]MBG9639408.1 portal protein [Bacillus thuringiensis]MBG9670422.1 portal protein [Bacillus thuringiensis]